MLNDAIFQEADNFSSMAVWITPGKKVVNYANIIQSGFIQTLFKLGFGGVKRMLVDFVSVSDAIKARQLKQKGIEKYYYLFFVGTVEESQGRGLAKVLIRKWQERSAEEGDFPIWLEATTPKSRDVYVKCGFEVLEEMTLGIGTHNADGDFEKGGEGVKLWAMLWQPSSKNASDL
ncbi:putative acyl-CoA N-acyltransferase [Septoria linicola]|nr:putative acyl-CoA N-acyltransferase [Septoria linicola]